MDEKIKALIEKLRTRSERAWADTSGDPHANSTRGMVYSDLADMLTELLAEN